MNILGVDYGEERLGIAIGNYEILVATPLCQARAGSTKEKLNLIEKIIKERQISHIILGLPLSLAGSDSNMSIRVRKFAHTLTKKLDVDVILWDERLTTKQVEKSLIQIGVSRRRRRKVLDKLSACVILQSYFDHQKNVKGPITQ